MKNSKIQQDSSADQETQKRKAEQKAKKEELKRQKMEEYKEAQKRQETQKQLAEEASIKLGKRHKEWYMNPYYLVFGSLGALLLYVIVMLFLNHQPPLHKTPVLDEKKISEHNEGFPWRQGSSSFWEGQTLADAKGLFTTSFATHQNLNKCIVDTQVVLPDNFDVRKQWPNCKLPVQNQSKKCNGAYALSLATAQAERSCISSLNQNEVKPLSAQEMLSCDTKNHGCRSGALNIALEYMMNPGLAPEKCLEYKGNDVQCSQACKNPEREKIDTFCIVFGGEDIMREIFKHGPVVATMQIYSDFLTYSKGVYVKGDDVPRFSGMHAVKIIGWGTESGDENEPNSGNRYWLVENTWGDDWGEHGVAKVSFNQGFLFEQYAYGIKTHNEILRVQEANEAKKQQQQNQDNNKAQDIPDMNLDDDNK
jgi:cathepsin B